MNVRFWLTAGFVLILDRFSKGWIMQNMNVGDGQAIMGDLVYLRYIHNEGAAFGLMQGGGLLFVVIAAVVIAGAVYFLFKYHLPPMAQYALGLITGGALGNLIDRVMYGSVVDFISVGWFPVFNLADCGIVCGGTLLVLWLYLLETGQKTE